MHDSLTKNPRWAGALAKLDVYMEALSSAKILDEVELSRHPGACAWLVGAKARSWRSGCSHVPLPGVAALFINTSLKAFGMHACPISGMLAQGFAITDYPQFLESPSGTAFFQGCVVVLRLPLGGILFCPAGWLCSPFAMYDDDLGGAPPSDKQPVKKRSPFFAYMLHVPIFGPSLYGSVADLTMSAIITTNSRHINKKKPARVWSQRAEVWGDFLQKLKTPTS